MTKPNQSQDLLKIEVATTEQYAGSDWCAEMFDRFDSLVLGSGVERDQRIRKSGIKGAGWLSIADAGTVGFFRAVSENTDLQEKLSRVESTQELIEYARGMGYEVTEESVKDMARQTFERWQSGLTGTVREFFEIMSKDKSVKKRMAKARGPGEIISLAKEVGLEIDGAELEPLHLKLNELENPESRELYGAMLALQILRGE